MSANHVADQDMTVDHPYFDSPSDPLLKTGDRAPSDTGARLDWRQALGGVLILVGVVLLGVGWYQVSGTTDTFTQLTYFLSCGIGGASAIVIGATVLVIFEHVTDRRALQQIDDRLIQMENRHAVEFALLSESRLSTSGVHAKADGQAQPNSTRPGA